MTKLALLVLMFGACTSSDEGEFQGAQVVGSIDFAMQGGLGGGGDGTEAHIEPDGSATRRLPNGALVEVQLSESRRAELYDQVARAELDTRDAYYNAGADYYTYVITAELASGPVTVWVDTDAVAPQTLRSAAAELHEFARTGE